MKMIDVDKNNDEVKVLRCVMKRMINVSDEYNEIR